MVSLSQETALLGAPAFVRQPPDFGEAGVTIDRFT
jgi:hypothetical protein